PLMDFFTSIGLVILLFKGGSMVLANVITLGTLVAMQRYLQKLVWPMMALGFSVSFYQRARASTDRLDEIFKEQNEVREPPAPGPRQIRGEIEFRNLSFRYPGSEKDALKSLSFRSQPGMRTAIVGPVGSGKSTLLGLIPRFYLAPEQALFIDGHPVEEFNLGVLRRSIAYVSQEPYLFSETLMSNIAWGDPDNRMRSMEQVIEQSQLKTDLSSLPEKEQTILGERGVNLSGGQRQRVAIARAWWLDSPILLMDDTLSAVDVHTEERLLQALKQESGSKNLIISSHRISTVREAEQILVLNDGTLVDQGQHSELIQKKNSIYARFYERQRREEDLEQFLDTQARPSI
ncbi:MAG: ABC transporter ATP-binding protein, partial [Proteobacteria bacterium]